MLEQIFTPVEQDYILLDEKKKLMHQRINYISQGFNPERPGRESFRLTTQKGIEVVEMGSPLVKEGKRKRRFSINFTEESLMPATQQSNDNMHFSTHQLQKPIKISYDHQDRGEYQPFSNNVLNDDFNLERETTDILGTKKKTNHVTFNKKSVRFKKRDSIVSHRDDYFSDPQLLEQKGKYRASGGTDVQFKLSIWKFTPFSNEQASILAETLISVSNQKVFVFKNQLFFSNDAQYVYLFLHNEGGWMMKGLIFYSEDLQKPSDNSFDMDTLNIHVTQIIDNPLLLRVSFDSEQSPSLVNDYKMFFPLEKKGVLMNMSGEIELQLPFQTLVMQEQYQIKDVLFQSWNYQKEEDLEILRDLSDRILLIVQNFKEGASFQLKIYHCSISKLVKIYMDQKPEKKEWADLPIKETIIEKFKVEHRILNEYHHIKAFQDYKCQNVFLQLQSGFASQQKTMVNFENAASFIIKVPQEKPEPQLATKESRVIQEEDEDLQEEQVPTPDKVADVKQEKVQPAQMKITFLEDVYTHMYPQFKVNLRFVIWNEVAKQYVSISASQLEQLNLTELSIELNDFSQSRVQFIDLQQYEPELNIFDIEYNETARCYVTLDSYQNDQALNNVLYTAYVYDRVHEQDLDKLDVMHFNPFLAIVESKSLFSLFNIHDPSICHQIRLPNDFIQFVELYEGYVEMGDSKYYSNNTCMFLTLDRKRRLSISIIKLPGYDVLSPDASQIKFEILHLKATNLIDWNKYCDQKLIKAVLGSVNGGMNDERIYLIMQLENEITIHDLFKGQILISIETGKSKVPMATVSGSIISEDNDRSIYIFAHSYDDQQRQIINTIKLPQSGSPSIISFHNLKGQRVLRMQTINYKLMILDEFPQIKTFRIQTRNGSLKEIEEDKIVDEAKLLFQVFTDPEDFFQITEEGLYLGPTYFQRLRKYHNKDNSSVSEFESNRVKLIFKLQCQTLLKGPIPSSDKSRMVYLSFGLVNQQKSFKQNIDLQTQIAIMQNQGRINRFNVESYNLRYKNSKNQKHVESQIVFQIFETPYIMQNEIDLIHKDKFFKNQVKFSTFTIYDDILVMVGQRFLIFNRYGKPLKIKVDDFVEAFVLENSDCRIIQIKTIRQSKQAFLCEDNENFYVISLTFERTFYFMSKESEFKKLQKNDEDNLAFYQSKLSKKGQLYQMLIEHQASEPDAYKVKLTIDNETNPALERLIQRALNPQQPERSGIDIIRKTTVGNNTRTSNDDSEKNIKDPLLTQSKLQNAEHFYGFEILHSRYFIFKKEQLIFYVLFDDLERVNDMALINLQLRKGYITQLLQTQKKHLLQFVYVQVVPYTYNFVITWDLQRNIEQQILEVPGTASKVQHIKVFKGVQERLNYYIPEFEDYIYDIRFEYPYNFFNGRLAHLQPKIFKAKHSSYSHRINKKDKDKNIISNLSSSNQQLNEVKMASENSMMLGISKEQCATIQLPYCMINLQYMEYILEYYREDQKRKGYITNLIPILKLLKFNIENSNNILHVLATNQRFLNRYLKEIQYQVTEIGSHEAENFVYYVLFTNNCDASPFTVAMQKYSPKCIELMIQVLSLKNEYDYFTHLKRHLFDLIEMQSVVFEKFLDECSSISSYKIRGTWRFNQDIRNFTNHTQYISDEFIIDKLGIKKEELDLQENEQDMMQQQEEIVQPVKGGGLASPKWSYKSQKDMLRPAAKEVLREKKGLMFQEEPGQFIHEQTKANQRKPIIFNIYDFGWLIRGKNGQQFIKYLASQKTESSLFKIFLIQTIINCQWDLFKKQYLKYQFLPMCLYILVILLFNSVFNKNLQTIADIKENATEVYYNLEVFHYCLGFLMLIGAVYFIILEVNKLRQSASWVILFVIGFHMGVIATAALAITDLVFSFKSEDSNELKKAIESSKQNVQDTSIIISATLVIWAYFIFLLQLRIFDKSAVTINAMFNVFRGALMFFFIFFFITFGFGNTFFILSFLDRPDNIDEKMTGPNMWTAFLFAYRTTLADIQVDKFEEKHHYQAVFYIFFIFETLMILIVLFNLLIAVLIDVYNQVMAVARNERLKVKCQLINENEFIFKRNLVFKDVKYIVVAEVENIQKAGHDEWNGIINSITSSIKHTIESEQDKFDATLKSLKRKLLMQGGQGNTFDNFQQEIKQLFEESKGQQNQILAQLGIVDQRLTKIERKNLTDSDIDSFIQDPQEYENDGMDDDDGDDPNYEKSKDEYSKFMRSLVSSKRKTSNTFSKSSRAGDFRGGVSSFQR